jgi:peptide/nickel transport system substrate-binding protein
MRVRAPAATAALTALALLVGLLGMAGCTDAGDPGSPDAAHAVRSTTAVSASPGSSPGTGGTGIPSAGSAGVPGGTLRLLTDRTFGLWDPQRLGSGPELAIAMRTFVRTLTGYPAGGVGGADGLTGDLATDTGTASEGGKVWAFTLRDGLAWEDGQALTCQDVKYGVSRNFARNQLPGGSSYPFTLLDIPRVKNAAGVDVSAYGGPFEPTGQDLFDKAVSCADRTITFRLKVAVPDFPQVVALSAFAAYRADKDRGGAGGFDVFSCGPYRLEKGWSSGNGGTFVRNPQWKAESDPLRKALPDAIEIREGIPLATLVTRLVESKAPDDTAIGLSDLPRAAYETAVVDEAVRRRLTTPASGTVEYLLPNFRSEVMTNPTVRQAFAMATDREAFATAYGSALMRPTYAVLAASVPGSGVTSPFGTPPAGDPAAAKDLLTAAGITLPVTVRVAYRSSATADAAFGALKARWEAAGFAVQLAALGENYYRTIAEPDAATAYDVFRAAWYADYPSGAAVIPSIFDGRVNLTASGSGTDYGYFNDDAVNTGIEAAYAVSEPAARAAAWGALDLTIAKLGGHVALGERQRVFLHGSAITGYADNPLFGGWPDLAAVGVAP